MARPRAIVLRAPGTNCDEETAAAWQRAGAAAETWHVNRLIESPEALAGFQILTIPGGFLLRRRPGRRPHPGGAAGHRAGRRPAPVSRPRRPDAGHLQRLSGSGARRSAPRRIEPPALQRWRTTIPGDSRRAGSGSRRDPGLSPFVSFTEPIELPVAHGEGKLVTADPAGLERSKQTARSSSSTPTQHGRPTDEYPANPNGSPRAAAGVCDRHRPDLRLDAAPRAIRRSLAPSALDAPS